MRAPVITVIRGEPYSLLDLHAKLRISWNVLCGWRRSRAGVTERRVERFLRDREERRRLREMRDASGITLSTYYARIRMGWDPAVAASTPARARSGSDETCSALRQLRRAAGVTDDAYHNRVRRGWRPHAAATAPMRRDVSATRGLLRGE